MCVLPGPFAGLRVMWAPGIERCLGMTWKLSVVLPGLSWWALKSSWAALKFPIAMVPEVTVRLLRTDTHDPALVLPGNLSSTICCVFGAFEGGADAGVVSEGREDAVGALFFAGPRGAGLSVVVE